VFFDDFAEGGFDHAFAMTKSVGDAFLAAYLPILERRRDIAYGERERDFQAYRRGATSSSTWCSTADPVRCVGRARVDPDVAAAGREMALTGTLHPARPRRRCIPISWLRATGMRKVPRRILIGLGILLLVIGLVGLIAWELVSSALEARFLARTAQKMTWQISPAVGTHPLPARARMTCASATVSCRTFWHASIRRAGRSTSRPGSAARWPG
jgi:hypothetical protein